MDREEFTEIMDRRVKPVRAEFSLNQDEMAKMLGISKKTLIEIEKGRKSLSWSGAVALSSVFSDSQILKETLGGDVHGFMMAVAFSDMNVSYPETMGGKIWWNNVIEEDGYRIQQNSVSTHYRILDSENRRLFSSFSLDETIERMHEEIKNRRDRR